jgi:hypothetical protein
MPIKRMEAMNRAARFAAMLTGLVLLLHGTPNWSQEGVNPTFSDLNENTAGVRSRSAVPSTLWALA